MYDKIDFTIQIFYIEQVMNYIFEKKLQDTDTIQQVVSFHSVL